MCDVKLSIAKYLSVFSVNDACLAYYFVMHLMVLFFIFMHLYIASHLGTLDAPREGCDVGAEPEDGVWCTYPEGGRTGQVLGREILT